MKARDIAQAIQRQESHASQTRFTDNDKLACASDSDGVSANSNVPLNKGAMAKLRGPRSASNQNTSTQISSKSDTDEAKEGRRASTLRTGHSATIQRIANRKQSASQAADKQKKDAPFAEDMMELISEEELSVCRSEGSPPRKKPRGKIDREVQ